MFAVVVTSSHRRPELISQWNRAQSLTVAVLDTHVSQSTESDRVVAIHFRSMAYLFVSSCFVDFSFVLISS